MKQSLRRLTIAAGALALAMPALAAAQQPAPRMRELPPADATRILNLRRVLDLTPRQVMQLDSIERVQVAARRAMADQMRARRDSVAGTARQGMAARGGVRMMRDSVRAMSPEQRQAMRDSMRQRAEARMAEVRPQLEQARRRDSVSRAAAERVLNDAQRQRLREIQAEERGRQRGLREARVRSLRGGERRMIRPGTPGRVMRQGVAPGRRPTE